MALWTVIPDALAPAEALEEPGEHGSEKKRERQREAGAAEKRYHLGDTAETVAEKAKVRRFRRFHEHYVAGAQVITQQIVCLIGCVD